MSGNKAQPRLPLIAVVGRPNVGKSTLFNRLAGSRLALVDDEPGVTRDRIYSRMEWLGRVWALVDTGGFEPEAGDILAHMRAQTEAAIAEADAVIFLLDGKKGINPADHEVAMALRKSAKPVFYVVNKVDGPRHEGRVADFHELGADRLFAVSATHGYAVDELLDAIAERVPGVPQAELEEEEDARVRVAVIGKPNVGKSTLINALLGQDRLLVHDRPGTTRDAIDTEVRINNKTYLFVDTAGMRRKSRIDTRLERYSAMRALKSIERCHLAIIIMDAKEGVVDQDAKIAGLAHDRGRAIILVFNKWDLVEDTEKARARLERQVADRLPHVAYAPVLTISALEKKRVGKLGQLIEQVTEQHNKRVSTGELNRRLEAWLSETPPPSGAKPVKIFYASQTGVRPPSFVFFANRPENVPTSYQRYLTNRLRDAYGFEGTPIKTFFRPRKKKPR